MPVLRMAGVAVFVLTMVGCTGGPTVDSTAPPPPSTEVTSTTSPPTTTPTPTSAPTTTTPEPDRQGFDSPQEYATAAYDAWLAEDWTTIERLATPEAADAFRSSPAEGAGLSFTRCEGAAGSMYCTWESTSARLEMRVAIAAASTGQDHAITEMSFTSD